MSLLTTTCLGLATLAAADEPPSSRYAKAIEAARVALEAGRPDEARAALDATDRDQRSFEFAYLAESIRRRREGGEPPAIGRVKTPDVATRYGLLNPKTKQVAFLCRDGALRLADATRPEAEFRVIRPEGLPEGDAAALWSGAWSADGRTFAAGDGSGRVRVFDAASWEPRAVVPVGEGRPVRELELAPDGSAFVAEGDDGLILWDLTAGRRVGVVGERYNFGEGLAFSPRGDRIATGGMFDVLVHDAATGARLREIDHASYTMGLAFSPDGRRIASAPRGNVNRRLAVFDAETGAVIFDKPLDDYAVGLAFSPDGRRLVATSCDDRLRLLDAQTGAELLSWERPGCGAKPAFSDDGRMLAWSEPEGVAFLLLDAAGDPGRP